LRFEFQIVIVEGEQADIVRLSSRQPWRLATRSTAGNQESAWLSPKRAIVVVDDRCPYRQVPDEGRPFCSTWQPSRYGWG
jgi:hypothetical protein